jgi:hypothetical protein
MVATDRVQLEFAADSAHEADYFEDLFIGLLRAVHEIMIFNCKAH